MKGGYLWGGGQVHVQTSVGQRDSTRTQNYRCTLRARRLHPLKQQVRPFGFIIPCFREWHKCLRHHENQQAKTTHQQRGSTRNQNDRCTLRSRRLHLLKQQVHPFGFIIPCFREWHKCLRHHENQLAKTTHQQRDFTRNQTDRCTLNSRRLHPLKQQVHPFGFIIPCCREWHKCLRHQENQLDKTTHQQRDSTRNQNDRYTLRSRLLHPLKQQVHPFGFIIRVSVNGTNVCGITKTNWPKPHINSVTSRETRLTAVRSVPGDSTLSSNKFIHLVLSFRVPVNGTNVRGIKKTNWPKPHTNRVTPRETRMTAVR